MCVQPGTRQTSHTLLSAVSPAATHLRAKIITARRQREPPTSKPKQPSTQAGHSTSGVRARTTESPPTRASSERAGQSTWSHCMHASPHSWARLFQAAHACESGYRSALVGPAAPHAALRSASLDGNLVASSLRAAARARAAFAWPRIALRSYRARGRAARGIAPGTR